MQNGSKIQRPPIPDTWGSENASPTQYNELSFEEQSIVFQPGLSTAAESSTYLPPTEEFLQMTKRLIERNLLPSRTTIILQDIYVRYKSIQGYGPTVWDTPADVEASTSGERKTTKGAKHATADLRKQEEKPSTFKKHESLTDSRESVTLDQSQGRRISIDIWKDEQHKFKLQTVQDSDFDYQCDPKLFEIETVFSDFSLGDTGTENTLKRRISHRIRKQSEESSRSSLSVSEQSVAPVEVEEEQPNENVDQGTETNRDGRLLSILKNIKANKRVGTTKD